MTLALAPQLTEKLTPLERLEVLCDPGSLHLIRSDVMSSRMGAKAVPGDGVLGGAGRVDGRPVYCYAQDPTFAGGSLGGMHADTIVRILRLAGKANAPVVGFVESAGARLQEGLDALGGYGRIFAEHVRLQHVPQISIITGASAGGGSYSPALTDFVVMTDAATMFLTGPGIVEEVMGEQLTAAELGGPKVHDRNGVSHFRAKTDADAAMLARDLLGHLDGKRRPSLEALGHAADAPVPDEHRQSYDVRLVIKAIADGGHLVEVAPRWARNIVTAFARIDGRPVGVIANQPRYLGGVLDSEASQKGAEFVEKCNRFGVPLVVLVDTPGFLPGRAQERNGVIRHGASLVHAFAGATVPKVTVVLRKAFGGAFIAMNSKELGADLAFAWPSAQLGVMGAKQAVGIVHRRDIAADPDPERASGRFARAYADEHLSARSASAIGAIDEVIAPSETRTRLAAALEVLSP
jgi:acetyl-CoA carboxylase carboxyltransferase component